MFVIVPMTAAIGARSLDVVVMALLLAPDLGFEAQDLLAVLAELVVRLVLAGQNLLRPLGEGVGAPADDCSDSRPSRNSISGCLAAISSVIE